MLFVRSCSKCIWFGMCRATYTFVMLGMHLDRHVSSDMLISHYHNTFGSACVERYAKLACFMSLQQKSSKWIGSTLAKQMSELLFCKEKLTQLFAINMFLVLWRLSWGASEGCLGCMYACMYVCMCVCVCVCVCVCILCCACIRA